MDSTQTGEIMLEEGCKQCLKIITEDIFMYISERDRAREIDRVI